MSKLGNLWNQYECLAPRDVYKRQIVALDAGAISGYYSQTRLARSMGWGDDMFRTWSGPEGSSHKEPLTGTRSHRAHGAFFCADAP